MGLTPLRLPKKRENNWLSTSLDLGRALKSGGLTFSKPKSNPLESAIIGAARSVSPNSWSAPKPDNRNWFSRQWDQINIFDSGRSHNTPIPSRQQANSSSLQQGYRQLVEPTVVNPIQHTANTLGAGTTGIIGLGQAGYQSIFGTDQSYQNKLNETRAAMRDILNGGWGNKGAFGSYEELTSDNPVESFVKPVTRGVAEVAPLVVPALPKTGGLGTRIATGAAEAGGTNLATDAALQLAETGRIDPIQSLKMAALGVATGGAFPVAGSVIRRVGQKAGQVLDNTIPSRQVVVRPRRSLIPQGEGGFVQVGRTPKNIHPEDVKIMADFIDHARGIRRLDPRTAYNLELDASRIAEFYGIKPRGGRKINPVTRLANAFDDRIMSQRQTQRGKVYNPMTRQWIDDPGAKQGGYVRVGRDAKTPEQPAIKVRSSEKPGKVVVTSAKNGTLQEIKRGISDADQVILDELRSIEKQTGQKGLVDRFMYRSNQQRGSNRVANVMLEKSKNVREAIGNQSKKEARAFSEYANARSELSFAKSQKTPTGRQKKIRTSRPVEELEAIVQGGEEQFGKRFKALNKHYQELSEMAADAGIIDKKTLETYRKNKDYIRIQRDLEDKIPNTTAGRGQGYKLGSTTLRQRRKGSRRATLDAAEVMAERTQQIHREVAKNKSGIFLTDTLEKAGLAKQVPSSKASTLNTVSVFKNGKKIHYEVSPAMKEAMDNISPYQMNVVMKVLAAPGRVSRAGITGLNPVFIARNLVKDQFGSAINSKAMLSTHNPKTFFRGLYEATKDAVGGKNESLWDDFLKHYGDQTSFDLTSNVKTSKQVIGEIRGGKKVKVFNKVKSPGAIVRSLEDLASITEKSTRYQNFKGAYTRAIKEGLPKEMAMERAAIQAWQNSVDFARAGTWGRVINTIIPYWNPATQGVRQMGRTFKDRPITSVMKGATLVGLPLVTASAWNNLPGNKEIYDNIPDFEKENNIILIPPGTKQNEDGTYDVFKIPLPPGFKDVFMPLRRAMDSYAGDKPVEFGAMGQDILQAVTGPIQTGSKDQFLGSTIYGAAIVKPFVQLDSNKDFYSGRQTVPDYMNEATDAQGNPVAEKDKAYGSTSGTARVLGGAFNMSPIKVEKFIKDSSGTVGLNLLNLADNMLAAKGSIPKEQIGGQSVAEGFKRSFASTQGIENYNKSDGAKYFDTLTRLQSELKLTQSERDAWGALHPAKKNFLGEQVYERDATYDPAARLDIYNRFPKVYELDKRLDAEQRKQGKPGNPMFDLENWQLKKVLEKENLPPGAKDPELTNLYQKEWYQNYRASKTEFFDKLAKQAKEQGRTFGSTNNPYPETPPDVQRAMDIYNGLPKGTGARSAWIRSNPGMWLKMQQQFAATDNWQNIARGKRGLDMTEGELGRMAGYGDSFSSGGSNFGGGSTAGLNVAKFLKKYNVGGQVRSGQAKSSGKVTVKARTSGNTGGKIKVTSRKIRLA